MAKLEKPWRYSHTERKILRSWLRDNSLHFDDEFEASGQRTKVSGEFLAALIAGDFGPPSQGSGTLFLGWICVTGRLSASGVSGEAINNPRGMTIRFDHCEFEKPVLIRGGQLNDVRFYDCTFSKDEQSPEALSFEQTTINDCLTIARCKIRGNFALDSAHIDKMLTLRECEFDGIADFTALRCDQRVSVTDCTISSLEFTRANLHQQVVVRGCNIHQRISFFKAYVEDLEVENCKFLRESGRFTGLYMSRLDCRRSLLVQRVSLNGPLVAIDASVGRNVWLYKATFANAPKTKKYVDFKNATVGTDANFSFLNLREGSLYLEDMTVGAAVSVTNTKALKLDLTRTTAGSLSIVHSRLESELLLAFAEIKFLAVIGKVAEGSPIPVSSDPVHARADPEKFGRSDLLPIDLGNMSASRLKIYSCAFNGGLILSGFSGRKMEIETSIIYAEDLDFPLMLNNARCEEAIQLAAVGCNGGIGCGYVQCETMYCFDVKIAGHDAKSDNVVAFGGGDMTISRHLEFGALPDGSGCEFRGGIILDRLDLQRNLIFSDIICGKSRPDEERTLAFSVSLLRARIGGNLVFEPIRSYAVRTPVVEFEGCVRLSASKIEGDCTLRGGTFKAIREGASDAAENKSLREQRKRGFDRAITLEDASINGSLIVGKCSIDGLVDLSGGFAARVLDRGGPSWRESGIDHGQLVLSGFTYDGLSSPEDDEMDASESTSRRPKGLASKDEVQRRLEWLALQWAPQAPEFISQPYEQLAFYFSGEGDERARRTVLIEKREMQRKFGGVPLLERALGFVLKATSNYGYSPARAIIWLLVYFGFGTLVAWALGSAGAIQPNSTDMVSPYPYNYLVLAIDAAIPIIDLEHDSMLTINPAALPEWASQSGILIGKAIYEILGMLLLSIAVLTLTGTLREKE